VRPMRWWPGLVVVLGFAVGFAVVAFNARDDPAAPDKGSEVACAHFRSSAGDAFGGTLDAATVLQIFEEIDVESTDAAPEVKAAARRMLRAADEKDESGLITQSQAMATACAEAGH
jgi:hypothetical protein